MTAQLETMAGLLIHSTRLSAKLKLHLNDVEWTQFMNGIAILIRQPREPLMLFLIRLPFFIWFFDAKVL